MMRRVLIYGSLLAFLVLTLQALAQVEEPPTNIAIIMDASGSMQALIEANRSRIAVAREEIIALSSELDPNVATSLWVYGHRLSQEDPAASCLDIERVIPEGPPDPALFASTVNNINAIGYTPLATSLGMAYSGLPPDGRSIIVLMSDGEESCGGDPCAIAAELDARNVELRIHTIGFAADAGTRAQLQCIAEVTGGNYYEAQDTEGLRQALQAATTPITGTIAIVRSDGEIASGISFTVVDSAGQTSGAVVSSGSFAPGDYTVTVNTDPPFEAPATVVAGETTHIVLPELGLARVVNASGEVLEHFLLTAYAPGTTNVVGSGGGGVMQLLPGTYEVEVGNLSQRNSITIEAGQTVDIQIDFGALQLVDASGAPTDEFQFYVFAEGSLEVVESSITGTANLLPGTYDVEVSTNPRFRQTVTVAAGETTEISLPGIGTLEVVDSAGEPVSDYSFYVYPEGGERQTTSVSNGVVDLLAGTYEVEVATNPPTQETITISAGETTQIVLPGIGSIEVVDAEGNPIDDYYFYVYPEGSDDYIAYSSGRALDVAAGTYDVEVGTNPTTRQIVTVSANETTTVQIGGMGTIQILDSAGNGSDEYAFYVYEPDGEQIASGFGSADIAAGMYDVEVYTNPIVTYSVTVTANETIEVTLPPIGTIEVLDAEGNLADAYPFYVSQEGSAQSIGGGFGSTKIVAGTYDLEIYTNPHTLVSVTVEGGETTDVILAPMGTLQLVDAAGNPTDAQNFTVYPEGSDDYAAVAYNGTVDLIAGDYEVVFDSNPDARYPVTITVDEVTEIPLPEGSA